MKYLFLLFILFSISCTGTQRAAINPPEVGLSNTKRLEKTVNSLPVSKTPKHRLKVVSKEVRGNELKSTLVKMDKQFDEFYRCFNIKDKGSIAREFSHYLVDTVFKCPDHNGNCAGYIKRKERILIISMDVFGKEESMPLLKHEWAHAYKIYPTDHIVNGENKKEKIKKCIKYM